MQGTIGAILLFSGIALPVIFRKRWINDFFLPGSFGRWLLASGYLVYPFLLYFIGLSLEQGNLPSGQGLRTIVAILLGIWLLTGAPAIFFGVLKSIRCRETRQTFAGKRHLPLIAEMDYPDLFPNKLCWFNPRLRNVLEVAPDTFIASVVRRTRTRTKGTDLLLLEKTARYPTFMAFRSRTRPARTGHGPGNQGEANDPLAASRIIVNDRDFLSIASELLDDSASPLEELDGALPASMDVVESVLRRLAEQGDDLFAQVEGVCLHDGHMLILLAGLLDREEQLSRWVSICTALKSRSRSRDEQRATSPATRPGPR
jgi:hypothetical protein